MPEDQSTLLGQTLRQKRIAAGFSVRRAAREAGFSEGRWRQLESGYEKRQGSRIPVNPKPTTVVRAADALGIDAVELLNTAGIDADATVVRTEIYETDHPEEGTLGGTVNRVESLEKIPLLKIDTPPEDKVMAVLVHILQELGHVDLSRLRDMLDGVLLVADRPLLERRLEAATLEVRLCHEEAALRLDKLTVLESKLREAPGDRELQTLVSKEIHSVQMAKHREHSATDKYFETKKRLDEARSHALPEGFEVTERAQEDG